MLYTIKLFTLAGRAASREAARDARSGGASPGRRGRRGDAGAATALRLALLAAPALCWAAVFAALAGVRAAESAVGGAHEMAQTLLAAAWPLVVAALLVCGAVRGGAKRCRRGARFTLAAGAVLSACGLLATLRPA
jgi:uncharacterized membrane protein